MKTDLRRLVVLAAAVAYIAAVFLWLGSDRRLARETFPDWSVHNPSPKGLSLAYEYLRGQRGIPAVSPFTRAVEQGLLPETSVLFRIAPGSIKEGSEGGT